MSGPCNSWRGTIARLTGTPDYTYCNEKVPCSDTSMILRISRCRFVVFAVVAPCFTRLQAKYLQTPMAFVLHDHHVALEG